jgi:hypothetical protein
VKSIAIVGIVLGMRFVQSFGFAFGNLKPTNVLLDESHRIQIVGIVPSRAESRCRKHFDENAKMVNEVPSEFAAPKFCAAIT